MCFRDITRFRDVALSVVPIQSVNLLNFFGGGGGLGINEVLVVEKSRVMVTGMTRVLYRHLPRNKSFTNTTQEIMLILWNVFISIVASKLENDGLIYFS